MAVEPARSGRTARDELPAGERKRSLLEHVSRSWWVALTLVPFGWLAWGAFVFAGARARRRRWVVFGLAYLVVIWGCTVLLGIDRYEDTSVENVVVAILLATWGAAFVHSLLIRGAYLDRMAVIDDPRLDRAERRELEREAALEVVTEDPKRARDLGVGRPDLSSAFHGGLVDLNHAPANVLADLPGFDRRLGERAVRIREEINGFESVDDLELFLDLSVDDIDRLRRRVVCLPFDA